MLLSARDDTGFSVTCGKASLIVIVNGAILSFSASYLFSLEHAYCCNPAFLMEFDLLSL